MLCKLTVIDCVSAIHLWLHATLHQLAACKVMRNSEISRVLPDTNARGHVMYTRVHRTVKTRHRLLLHHRDFEVNNKNIVLRLRTSRENKTTCMHYSTTQNINVRSPEKTTDLKNLFSKKYLHKLHSTHFIFIIYSRTVRLSGVLLAESINMKHYQSSATATSSVGCPFARKTTTSLSADEKEKSEDRRNSDSVSNFSGSGSCPFAQALHQNNDGDDSSSATSTDYSATSAMISSPPSPGSSSSLPWKECPVFANHSCPFKDVKSPGDVSQLLMQLPASHTDQTLPTHAILIETLAYFHRDQAMEEYSFSSIMSRLAREYHDAQSNAQHSNDVATLGEDDLGMDRDEILVPLTEHPKNDKEKQRQQVQSIPVASGISDTAHQQKQKAHRLSEALKTGTEDAHKEAESVHFVKNFIRGKIDRDLYALFVAQMFHVYRRLEKELDEHAPQNFADCHFPEELNRSEALRDDIDFWQGSSDEPPISPATQDYLDRITTVAKERPLILLAHAYTRYLGDLSGGKILARVAKRALLLDSGDDGLTEGLAFYDFPLLRGSVKAFKDRYRQALNDLQFEDTDEAVEAIVQEANIAFLMNMRLFEELDVIGSVPGASVRPIDQVYKHAAMAKNRIQSDKAEQHQHTTAPCPFANMSGASAFQHLHHHDESSEYEQQEQHKSHAKSCPWPFVFLHDPKAGMRQWQTWMTIGLLLMYTYQQY
jgi:heme oxygenase